MSTDLGTSIDDYFAQVGVHQKNTKDKQHNKLLISHPMYVLSCASVSFEWAGWEQSKCARCHARFNGGLMKGDSDVFTCV